MARKKSLFPKPRKPSINRMLGISQAKSKMTKAAGGRAVTNPKAYFKAQEKKIKRKMGIMSPPEWWRTLSRKPQKKGKSEPKGCWPF